jgi:peptidoglycan/LPS O-acetylase OafA/YrhL
MPADLGVSIFFVLSGFLITWLLMKERERTGTVSLRDFYLRRAFRLLPAYYCYLAIAFAIHFGRHAGRTDIIAPSLFYYANYFNATHGHPATPISHTWSLAVEEQFYVFWPLAFLFFARKGQAAVVRFLVLSIGAVLLWRSFLYLVVQTGTAYVYNAFDTRFDNLAVGCLVAVLCKRERFVQLAEKVSARWYYPLFTVAALCVSRLVLPDAYNYSLGFSVNAVLIAIGILQLVQLADRAPFRFLNHPVARYVGGISYAMYLYNGLATTLGHKFSRFGYGLPIVVAILSAVVFGTLSRVMVEKPFLKLRERITRRAPAAPRVAPAPATV